MTCEREEFLWDEDPDVRRMLALVFSEEDTSGHRAGREEPQDQVGGGQSSVVQEHVSSKEVEVQV